jgi:hypothetical protein
MIKTIELTNTNVAFSEFKQHLYNEIGNMILLFPEENKENKKTIFFDKPLTIFYQSREYFAISITYVLSPEQGIESEIVLSLEIYKSPLQIEALFLDEMLKILNTLKNKFYNYGRN